MDNQGKSPESFSKVLCVIKFCCKNGQDIVNFDEENFGITPYHPIFSEKRNWKFPISIKNSVFDFNCKFVYNLILNSNHIISLGSSSKFKACTLAHGFRDDDIISHDYYGTNKCIKNLKNYKKEGFKVGFIEVEDNVKWIRNKNDLIQGFIF